MRVIQNRPVIDVRKSEHQIFRACLYTSGLDVMLGNNTKEKEIISVVLKVRKGLDSATLDALGGIK